VGSVGLEGLGLDMWCGARGVRVIFFPSLAKV